MLWTIETVRAVETHQMPPEYLLGTTGVAREAVGTLREDGDCRDP